MKKILAVALVAMLAGFASAQTLSWIGNSAVYHVTPDAWYNCSADWGLAGNFQDYDFGDVTSLILGGQAQTYEQTDDTSVYMSWTANGVDWANQELPWETASGNNNVWTDTTGVDVANGLANGDYTVTVYFQGLHAGTTVYDNNGGPNYSADFTVVPEPTTMALLGLGLGGILAMRRRHRKVD